ncbi:MAG: hypothetical protein RLO18_06035, partial [Gimesia chilikensis]
MTQTEPDPKRVSRLRWVWRGIGLVVVAGVVLFVVPGIQHSRAIQQLKSNPEIVIESEPNWVLGQLPSTWQ